MFYYTRKVIIKEAKAKKITTIAILKCTVIYIHPVISEGF